MKCHINAREIKTIYFKEILEIIRDSKILMLSVLLPIIIYPIIFWGVNKLQSFQEKRIKEKGFTVAIKGNPNLLRPYLENADFPVTFVINSQFETGLADKTLDLSVEIVSEKDSNMSQMWFYYNGSNDISLQALQKTTDLLEKNKLHWIQDQTEQKGIQFDRKLPVSLNLMDVSTVEARSGHMIAKILPFVLVMILIGGCSYTAVDAIAGEKERGSFETLLVAPITRHSVILGKFLIVLTTGLVSAFLNIFGMLISLKMGILKGTPGFNFEFRLSPEIMIGIFACAIPLGILFAAILMVFTARAKTFQEGQIVLLPFTLFAMLPTLAAVLPGMNSKSILLIVPIANIVVAIKEFLEGSANYWTLMISNAVNLFYATFTLQWAVKFLSREGTLIQSATGEPELDQKNPVKTGIVAFAITWIIFYYVMTVLQMRNLAMGLFITMWIFLPIVAIAYTKYLHLPIKETFRFNTTSIQAYISLPFLTLGTLGFVQWITHYQFKIIPIPESILKEMNDSLINPDFSGFMVVFLMCISPGINEEFLFRGAFLGGFLNRIKPWQAIILSSVLFGFLHFSIYRFTSTTLIGIMLGYLLYRSGSIFPPMIAHFLNNFTVLVILDKLDLPEFSIHWYLLGIPLLFAGVYILNLSDSPQKQSIDFSS